MPFFARFFVWAALFFLCAGVLPASAEPRFKLSEAQLEVVPEQGVPVFLGGGDVRMGSMPYYPARYVVIDRQASKKIGIEPSLLIFSAKGEFVQRFAYSQADSCRELSLSPDGKVLAIGLGEGAVRTFEFRSYPFFALLEEVPYFARREARSLYWAGDHNAVYTSVRNSELRSCESAPCGILSVRLLDPLKAESKVLAAGSEQCDYTPDALEGAKLAINGVCLASPEDWAKTDTSRPVKKRVLELGSAAQRQKSVPAKTDAPTLSTDTDADVRRKVQETARLLLMTDIFCSTQSGTAEADAILQGLVWRYGTQGMKEYAGLLTTSLQDMHPELEELLADSGKKSRQEKQCRQNLQKREQALRYFSQ